MKNIDLLKPISIVFIFFGCNAKTQFIPVPDTFHASTGIIYENSFELKTKSAQFQIAKGDVNKTTVNFRVVDSNNNSTDTMPMNDFSITENNYPILDFSISKKSTSTIKNVDIAFVFDVSGSMKTTIERAKLQMTEFVNESRAKGLSIRLCLVTFGDYTIKQCNKFYDTSPSNPNSEFETKEFLKEIQNLKAISGINDPGGNDLNENPMRAIIDAANAPWENSHQHFVILLTDDGFLYSPGNSGAVGNLAPTFPEVLSKISEKNLKVFAATHNYPGYYVDFKLGNQKYKSIVNHSAGEWFNYADLISQKISFTTIFNRIGVIVDTTFQANYELNGTSPIPAWLPLPNRDIRPRLKSTKLKIVDVSVTSNLPNGSSEQLNVFKLSDKKIRKSSLKVSVDGAQVFVGFRVDEFENLILSSHLANEAMLKVEFNLEDPLDAFEVHPINLLIDASTFANLDVLINGIVLDRKYFSIEMKQQNGKTYYSLELKKELFHIATDPYGIEQLHKFDLRIQSHVKPILKPRTN